MFVSLCVDVYVSFCVFRRVSLCLNISVCFDLFPCVVLHVFVSNTSVLCLWGCCVCRRSVGMLRARFCAGLRVTVRCCVLVFVFE